MAEAEGLTTCFIETEEEFIDQFCETYKDEIVTSDGFIVFCKYLEKTAKHFCCGKKGIFQKTRAQRLLWAKYILLNPEERIVLTDTKTKNTLFFLTRKRNPHIIICNKLDGKLNLISSFPVSGNRAKQYREGKPPYEFYKS